MSSIYEHFVPTYLYIKQHTKTGKLYFGKTVKDPSTYHGSGKRWLRHIKKHGKKIQTLWHHLFTHKDECVNFALSFSEIFNIVESDIWLNLIVENGINGGDNPTSRTPEVKNKIKKTKSNKTEEEKKLIRERIGNSHRGIPKGPQTPEHIKKRSQAKIGKHYGPLSEVHKLKISNALKGVPRPMTEEHKKALKCHTNNKTILKCPHCDKTGLLPTMKKIHFANCINLGPKIKFKCSYCDKFCGNKETLTRYHNNNCKLRPQMAIVNSK